MGYPNPSSNPKQSSSTSRASTWSIRAKEGHLCYCCYCPFGPLCFAWEKSSVARLEIPMHPNHHQHQYQLAGLLAVVVVVAAAAASVLGVWEVAALLFQVYPRQTLSKRIGLLYLRDDRSPGELWKRCPTSVAQKFLLQC